MTFDRQGRIWATAGTGPLAGIYVFDLDGKRSRATQRAFVALPQNPTNCAFGGKDRSILYVTSAKSLFSIKTRTRGMQIPPGK
jgi:sugar lactone lactonase YvrE